MLCSLADLDKEKTEAIQAFERKTGKGVLAYSCKDLGIADLSEPEMAELKDLENKLGLSLVAYK